MACGRCLVAICSRVSMSVLFVLLLLLSPQPLISGEGTAAGAQPQQTSAPGPAVGTQNIPSSDVASRLEELRRELSQSSLATILNLSKSTELGGAEGTSAEWLSEAIDALQQLRRGASSSKSQTFETNLDGSVLLSHSSPTEDLEVGTKADIRTQEPHRVCTMVDLFSRTWLKHRFTALQSLESQRDVLLSYALPDLVESTATEVPEAMTRRQRRRLGKSDSWHVANIDRVLLDCEILDLSIDGSVWAFPARSAEYFEGEHDMPGETNSSRFAENSTDDNTCARNESSTSRCAAIQMVTWDVVVEYLRQTAPAAASQASSSDERDDSEAAPRLAKRKSRRNARYSSSTILPNASSSSVVSGMKAIAFNLVIGGDGLRMLVDRMLSLHSRQFGLRDRKILPSQRTSTAQPFFEALILDGQGLGDAGTAVLAPLLEEGLVLDHVSLRHNGIGETGGAMLAESLRSHRARRRRDWFGLSEVAVDLRENSVCDNVGIDVFSNEFDDDLTATFVEVSEIGGQTHSHGPPVQCSARSSIDRQRACCMVDYLAPLEWSEWSKLPHRNPNPNESSVRPLIVGPAALDDEMNPVHALEVCNKADLDGRNMSERAAGLELSFSGSGHGLARCEVIALNPNNPQVGEEPVGDDGVIALASALFRCHRLRRLDVSHSNISSVGLKALLKGLKHAKALEALILDGNAAIGDEGARLVGRMLLRRRHSHSHLHHLSLRDCGLSAVGILELTETFNNPNIRRLELGGNRIGACTCVLALIAS
eukprot:INCI17465.2.p1 GENE.INCI17465.2~~INCI17465.2.p1  ORF type:complete len:767 (-),score=111.38 INCI17465.2:13-2313(-)